MMMLRRTNGMSDLLILDGSSIDTALLDLKLLYRYSLDSHVIAKVNASLALESD